MKKRIFHIAFFLILLWVSPDGFAQVAPPKKVNAVGFLRAIVVQWSPSPTSGVVEYRVFRSTNLNKQYTRKVATVHAGGRLRFIDFGVLPGIRYYYVVKAFTQNGSSPPSREASAKLVAPGNAVVIISRPPKVNLRSGSGPFIYYVRAVAPDTSKRVTFRLISSPPGMVIGQSSGILIWPHPVVGVHKVRIKANEAGGKHRAAEQVFRLLVARKTGSVTGLVKATNGKPVRYAHVVLFNINEPDFIYQAWTDSSGVYSVSNVATGSYYVGAEALRQGYGYRWYPNADRFFRSTVVTVRDTTYPTQVDFLNTIPVLSSSVTMTGVVRDTLNKPIAGATVRFFRSDTFIPIGNDSLRSPGSLSLRERDSLDAEVVVKTDNQGKFTVQLRAGKKYFAYSSASNYRDQFLGDSPSPLEAQAFVAVSGGNVPGVNLPKESQTSITVEGAVIDAFTKQPLEKIPLVLVSRSGGHVMFKFAVSDTSGSYVFRDVPSGTYQIHATPNNDGIPTYYKNNGTALFWDKGDSVVISASVSGLDIEIPRTRNTGLGSISGTVTDATSGDSIRGLVVLAFEIGDTLNAVAFCATDSLGSYKIEGLLPGTYILKTDKVGYHSARTPSLLVNYTSSSSISDIKIKVTQSALTNAPPPDIPGLFFLEQNYPNPAGSASPSQQTVTNVTFGLATQQRVELTLYDALGRKVKDIVVGDLNPGEYVMALDVAGLPSGLYLYRLRTQGRTLVRRMIVMN